MSEQLTNIFNKEFIQEIERQKGEIYLVGGCVRDFILKKEPKDIDVIVRNIEYEKLSFILSKYGKVDLIGKSFGVIKFCEFITKFEVEIALPRKDKKSLIGSKHTDIISETDPKLSLEEDLQRRDFTINSIAMDKNGNYIDPFNGLKDLKNGIISATNLDAFSDDPLRMLRAIQFSARFKFEIDKSTQDLIIKNKNSIKSISGERILMEFEKVFSKNGDVKIFLNNLMQTGLFGEIFEFENLFYPWYLAFENIKTLTELFFYCIAMRGDIKNKSEFLQTKFKIDNDIVKQIKALQKYFETTAETTYDLNKLCFDVLQICPTIDELDSIKSSFENFNINKYPRSYKEIAIDGNKLMAMGYEGIEIGRKQRELIDKILSGEISNNYEDIVTYLKKYW